MGYYTNYEIHFENIDEAQKEIIRQGLIDNCPDLMDNVLDYCGEQDYNEVIVKYNRLYLRAKWYNYDSELSNFTEKFPDLRVTVYGHGEDVGDEWVAYAKAGMVKDYTAELPASTLW